MDDWRRHKHFGLAYAGQYFRERRDRSTALYNSEVQASNEKALLAIAKDQQKKDPLKTAAQSAISVGTTIGGFAGPRLFKAIKANRAARLAQNENELEGRTQDEFDYDQDLENTMRDIDNEDIPERAGIEPQEPEEAFTGADEIEPTPMTDAEISQFQDPFTSEAQFGEGGTQDMIAAQREATIASRFQQVDEMARTTQEQAESGEIQPTDLDADPEEGMNFFQRTFSRAIFGKPAKPSTAEPEYDFDALGETERGGWDVGVKLDPDTLKPIGVDEPEGAESAFAPVDSETQAMLDAGTRAGNIENTAGDQALIDEYNDKFGTNHQTLDDVFEDMQSGGGERAEVIDAEAAPADEPVSADVVGKEAIGEDEPVDFDLTEDFGPPPPKPPRVQSLRFREPPVEEAEAPVGEAEQPSFLGSQVEAGARPGASDSTLARMFQQEAQSKAPVEESPEESPAEPDVQPEEVGEGESSYKGFRFGEDDSPEAKIPDDESVFGDIGDAGEEAAGETAGETAGEVAGEVGAEVGVDAAVEGLDVAAAATAPIPGLDIVMGVVAGLATAFGAGYSIYNAVENANKPKDPNTTPQIVAHPAPQPGIAGKYVGASSENYYNQPSHFNAF